MNLRRTLSKRLSKSLGLGIRFSKNMSPQSELFEHQESSEGESLESHHELSSLTPHYKPSSSRGYQQSSESESLNNHNHIATQNYETRESHESHYRPIVSYRPRRVFEEESATEDETSELQTRKRVERACFSRLSNKTEEKSALTPRECIERDNSSRLNSETEGDSEEELHGFIDKYYISHPRNEPEKESVRAQRERIERQYLSLPHNLPPHESKQEVQDPIDREIARWSQNTATACSSTSSADSVRTYFPDSFPYETRLALAQWIDFYSTEPLMRCLDTAEEKQYYDGLLFESLLSDVKEPIPAVRIDVGYRGVVQIRHFWENMRAQLSFEEDGLGELEWPRGYPRCGEVEERRPENEDALDEYLGLRWGEMFYPSP